MSRRSRMKSPRAQKSTYSVTLSESSEVTTPKRGVAVLGWLWWTFVAVCCFSAVAYVGLCRPGRRSPAGPRAGPSSSPRRTTPRRSSFKRPGVGVLVANIACEAPRHDIRWCPPFSHLHVNTEISRKDARHAASSARARRDERRPSLGPVLNVRRQSYLEEPRTGVGEDAGSLNHPTRVRTVHMRFSQP